METSNADMSGTGDYFPSGSMPESLVDQYDGQYGMGSHGMVENNDGSGCQPNIPATSANLQAGEDHSERLKKEADGLFAGIALLNELEPLEDVDERNVWSTPTQSIDNSLSRLRPEPSGKGIICLNCRHRPYSRAFPCTLRDIKTHLRDCPFNANFGDTNQLLEAIETIQERPASMTLITSLQRRCERIQETLASIPEIDDYLYRLEVLSGGSVNCILPGCSSPENISTFDIKTHFRVYHCPDFEGSLNEEFCSKMRDAIDEKCRRPWTQYLMSIISTNNGEHARKVSQVSQVSRVSLLEQKPSWEQMRVLRTLRSRFIMNHRLFLQRTATSSSDRLKRLRSSCRSSSKLLNTGILTLQEIMNDKSPSTLKEVFSFISLSNAMMWTMQARGCPVKSSLSNIDLEQCKMSLRDPEDRLAFDELMSFMWVELIEDQSTRTQYDYNLGFIGESTYVSQNPYLWDFDHGLGSFWLKKSAKHLRFTAEKLLDASLANEDFRFGDWLNFPADHLFNQKTNFDSENSIRETSWIDSQEIPQYSNVEDRSAANPPEMQSFSADGDQTVLVQLQSLSYTVLFLQCISFLIFIGGIGTLLQYLSGGNESCFASQRGLFTGRDIAGFSRFVEVSKFRILNVLCLDPELSNFRAIFNTVVKLLEAGFLQAVEDIERYLICVVKLFANSRSSYLAVVSKILNCSLNAVRDERMDDEYRYSRDHQDAELYDADYMDRRQEEASAAYTNDAIISESPTCGSFGNVNVQPTVELGEYLHEGFASEASSENRRTSEIATSPSDSSTVSRSSGIDKASSQSPSLGRASASRKCDVEGCGKIFTGEYCADGLARHKREKHSNRPSFTCPAQSCNHTSKRLHNLRIHWESKHKNMPMPERLIATPSCGGGGVKRKREYSITE